MKNNTIWTIIVLLAVVFVVLFVFGPFYTINEGEQAVITRFGKIIKVEQDAGLKVKVPFLDQVVKYPNMILSWDGDAQRIPTKENQFIWVDATARWKISDPKLFYETVNTIQGGIARLNDVLDSTIRTVISENYLNEAVRSTNKINTITIEDESIDVENIEDAETLKSLTNTQVAQENIKIGREGISNMILNSAKDYMPNYGIELVDIIIRQIRYSDDLTQSVYTRMIKERNQIAETYRSYGRGQLYSWQGRTENDKKQILSAAYAEAEALKGNADAEASRIYADSYSKNPKFFKLWRSLESYKKNLGSIDKLLSTDSSYFDYISSEGGR